MSIFLKDCDGEIFYVFGMPLLSLLKLLGFIMLKNQLYLFILSTYYKILKNKSDILTRSGDNVTLGGTEYVSF